MLNFSQHSGIFVRTSAWSWQGAEEIAEALAEVDPDHGADYEKRADALAGELHALDAWVRERVAAMPRDRRILVTDHDVFGYFVDRYGFTVHDTIIREAKTSERAILAVVPPRRRHPRIS